MTKDEQLIIEEYKSLKSEMQSTVDESVRLEVYAIGAIGGFYSWFLAQERAPLLSLVPVSFAIFGLVRSDALLRRVDHIATYIKDAIEVAPRGWERHFDEKSKTDKKWKLTGSVKWFWRMLVAITSLVAVVFLLPWLCRHCCFSCCHNVR